MSNTLDACLSCTLPICDDRSPECALVQIQPVKPKVDRSEYFKTRYAANRQYWADRYQRQKQEKQCEPSLT
jgi:hypothetical protein